MDENTGISSAVAANGLSFDDVKQIGSDVIRNPIGYIANFLSSSGRDINDFNLQNQKELLAWYEKMSNSEIQRRVEDIKKAGLNPWLALNSGSLGGASTPSASMVKYDTTAMKEGSSLIRSLISAFTSLSNSILSSGGKVANIAKAAAAA